MIAHDGPHQMPQSPTPELPLVPYRGIEPFRFIDQPIFCAREAEVRKLVRSTTIYRGVLLYGASGSGKSSLINAGLIPQLVEDGFLCERIRVQPRRGEEMILERIPLTHDGRPPYLPSFFEETKEELGAVGSFLGKLAPSVFGEGEAEARIVLSVTGFLARLRENARDRSVLLIFDQFEEFVTLFEEVPQVQSLQEAKEIQAKILDALVKLLRNQSLPVKLLFAFREDYLARLSALFRQCPDLTDQYLRLTSPDKRALLDIVRGPFRSAKAREHFGREMSEEVVHALAAEIEKRDDSDMLNLSEVEIVCDRLWHSDDPAQLLQKRGVQGLLEDYLSDELVRLKALRDPAVALLGRMVTSAGTRNVISEANLLEQVHKEEKLPEETLKTALSALETDTRLVQRERRNRVYFYEIVSEFLVPWIFRQKELREAAREKRVFRRRAFAVAAVLSLLSVAAWYWQVNRTSVKGLTARITQMKEELTETQASLEEREGQLEDRDEQLTGLQGDMQTLQASHDLLQNQHASLQAEKRRLQDALTATVRELEISRRTAQERQAEIENQIGLLQQERSSRQEDVSRLQSQLDEQQRIAQRTIDDLRERYAQIERRAQDELDTRTAEVVRLRADLQAETMASQEAITRLNGDINRANEAVGACRNQKVRLVKDKELAEADANKAREALAACQFYRGVLLGPP